MEVPMPETITPAHRLKGNIRLPGDKSISHRYGIIAALAEGTSKIHHYSTGADCQSTLGCMEALGATIERQENTVLITGHGLDGLKQPAAMLDAGNSGSTIRMLSGVLAAQKFTSRIAGDDSLGKRPMKRIMEPLALMGGHVEARDGTYPPLVFNSKNAHGQPLKSIRYEPPMASAQVKTCVLMAGLYAEGPTSVIETIKTRDHTELALKQFGADIETIGKEIILQGRPKLVAQEVEVPGDLSSAAFFLVAASLVPGSDIRVEGVGLNPSRTGLLDWLAVAGARIKIIQVAQTNGEIIGTLGVQYAPELKGGVIEGAVTAALIDEIPVLAILGAASKDGLTVRDAKELRVKETDRIATIAEGLQRMGVKIDVFDDGFHIPGGQKFTGASVDSHHDHRIAMAFAVAGLIAEGTTTIENSEAASVSFPEFYTMLRQIAE
jgi:3-phosphoshikimate 1-carboxyvinyltransferase